MRNAKVIMDGIEMYEASKVNDSNVSVRVWINQCCNTQ